MATTTAVAVAVAAGGNVNGNKNTIPQSIGGARKTNTATPAAKTTTDSYVCR